MSSLENLNPPAGALSARLHDLVFPEQSNHHGTLFGGAALAMLDKLAFILGSRAMRRTLVTAAVSRIDFFAPAEAGMLAEARGYVARKGQRSVEVEAELFAENLTNGDRTRCLAGRFVMVGRESEPLGPTDVAMADDPARVRVAELVLPSHTNHRGILHGAAALAWLSKAALVAASRDTRHTMVMARTGPLDFVAPARAGDIVEVEAAVTRRGRTSVHVDTAMFGESALTGERRLCTRADFVFVAIDEDGRPTPIPTHSITTPSSKEAA